MAALPLHMVLACLRGVTAMKLGLVCSLIKSSALTDPLVSMHRLVCEVHATPTGLINSQDPPGHRFRR